MFNIFSTREVASAIYLILFLAFVLIRAKDITLLTNLIKASLKKIFIIPILCLLVYAGLIVYGLQFIPLWNWILVKDVIIWVLFVATPVCFKAAVNRKKNQYPFKRMVIDNFVWSALLEFFIGAFTFTFVAEMFVVPTFSLIVLLQNHDRENEKYRGAHKLIDGISVITGLLLLVFTIDKAINVIAQDGIVDVLISFCIPIIFSVAFLPVVYFLALKGLYHDLFVLIRIRNKENEKMLSLKKKKVFGACGLSYRKVQDFRKAYTTKYIGKVCFGNDDNTFLSFVENFRKEMKDSQ
jgi:hypothetical protein